MGTPLPSLDSLDPVAAWQPWQPTAADPWSRKWAAHLYRRGGFGASRAELIEAERLGPQGALDSLAAGRDPDDSLQASLNDVGRATVIRRDSDDRLRGWWLYGMLHGRHPLREKMTLFWHNHFATSLAKVQQLGWMFEQNCLLRTHALGKFGPFLQAISRDRAMLIWLDSNSNLKEHPNENYARELMELFSLGVGNYTETDVREAARAFTGWHVVDGFQVVAAQHDDGVKTVLGRKGKWDGGDVVRIVLEQPAAARFIVRKLYAYLVSETTSPQAKFIEPLCERFRKSDYDIADLVRTILASRHFYSDHAFRQKVKSPVEYVVGAVNAVYRRYGEDEADYRALPHAVLVPRVAAMGQKLFAPPNVKGWPGGRSWLNTSTILERDNFAAALATGTIWEAEENPRAEGQPPPRAFDSARILEEERLHTPEEIVAALLDLHAPGGVRPGAREKLTAYVAAGKPSGEGLNRRIREAVHAIMTMPEYQLA